QFPRSFFSILSPPPPPPTLFPYTTLFRSTLMPRSVNNCIIDERVTPSRIEPDSAGVSTDPSARTKNTFIPPSSSIAGSAAPSRRSEEHTSELQSRFDLVCRLLLEKKKKTI